MLCVLCFWFFTRHYAQRCCQQWCTTAQSRWRPVWCCFLDMQTRGDQYLLWCAPVTCCWTDIALTWMVDISQLTPHNLCLSCTYFNQVQQFHPWWVFCCSHIHGLWFITKLCPCENVWCLKFSNWDSFYQNLHLQLLEVSNYIFLE